MDGSIQARWLVLVFAAAISPNVSIEGTAFLGFVLASVVGHTIGGGLNANTLWGTDVALDMCWIAVFLLCSRSRFLKRLSDDEVLR